MRLTALLSFVIFLNFSAFTQNNGLSEKDLIGTYKVDLSPLRNSINSDPNLEEGLAQIANGLVSLVVNAVDIRLEFLENNKAKVYAKDGDFKFSGDVGRIRVSDNEFEYRMGKNNMLQIKDKEDTLFKEVGSILINPTEPSRYHINAVQDEQNFMLDLIKLDN